MAAPHSPLKSGPSSVSSPAMAGTTGPASTTPGTVDFLLSTPPQVLILLSHAAPLLRGLTEAAKILTWKHSNRWSSFSVLLAWWLLCLLGDRVASYGIGPTLIASLALSYLLKKPQQPTSRKRLATQVMDADKLARVLEDARQCQHALSDFYVTYADPLRDLFTWQDPAYTRRVIYLLATSFPTYLAFTALFGTRYIFLIVGSCLFLAPSKFGKVLWINTRRSFILRLLLNLAFSVFIAGGQDFKRIWRRTRNAKLIFLSDLQTSQPPTSLDDSTVRMPPALVKEPSSVPSDISFTFTIFQNERWWIGLDWTQALLPSERPAWCDSKGAALPPPSTFSLPVPLINNIPSPSKAHPNAVLQRCIRWEWIDIDWHVRPDSHANTPVDAKSSETVDLSKQSSPPMNGPGGVADWARGKMAAATASSASSVHGRRGSWALGQTATGAAVPQPSSPQPSVKSGDLPVQEDDKDEGLSRLPKGASLESVAETEWIGDGQGWAYGDNSWDKMTSRQGMGKFTRRRVWVRRARVVESSRYIETGEDDVTSARKKSH